MKVIHIANTQLDKGNQLSHIRLDENHLLNCSLVFTVKRKYGLGYLGISKSSAQFFYSDKSNKVNVRIDTLKHSIVSLLCFYCHLTLLNCPTLEPTGSFRLTPASFASSKVKVGGPTGRHFLNAASTFRGSSPFPFSFTLPSFFILVR